MKTQIVKKKKGKKRKQNQKEVLVLGCDPKGPLKL